MPETHILTVWLCDVRGISEPDIADLHRFLDPAEQDFASRLKRRDTQKRYIASHALARDMMAELTGIDPDRQVYTANDNGSPAFTDTKTGAQLPISISRTDGLVACGFCLGVDFGIDIECLLPANADQQLVAAMFSKPEQEMLTDLSEDQFVDEFFQVWTLKEAYVKAEGQGLSLPLDDFAFTLDPPDIHFLSEDGRNKTDWAFVTLKPTDQYRLSAAVRTKGAPLHLVSRHVTLTDLLSESGKGHRRQ